MGKRKDWTWKATKWKDRKRREKEGKKKGNKGRRKENKWKNTKSNKEAELTKLLRKFLGLMALTPVIVSTG